MADASTAVRDSLKELRSYERSERRNGMGIIVEKAAAAREYVVLRIFGGRMFRYSSPHSAESSASMLATPRLLPTSARSLSLTSFNMADSEYVLCQYAQWKLLLAISHCQSNQRMSAFSS